MDGNNRWAKANGKGGVAGHKMGAERVRDIVEASIEQGAECLTLYAFSSENWQRPKAEVSALMKLLSIYLKQETKKLKKQGIKLNVFGSRERLSDSILKLIDFAEAETQTGGFVLNIAIDYGGKWDIVQAAKSLADDVQKGLISVDQIDESIFNQRVCLNQLPPPDLMIRTGGDQRISNYLLWQSAYTEFYFTSALWPDFNAEELAKALDDYASRQRRFGKTSEQIEAMSTETK